MTDPICQPCTDGSHATCEIWTCSCLHAGCPDQLTLDDALEDGFGRFLERVATKHDQEDL